MTTQAIELQNSIRTELSRGARLSVADGVTACAVAGGLWLRCARLGNASLWFDEGYTAWVVSKPVKEIVRIISVDTAPPLYYLLLREWALLFGYSEAALRSLSALMACIALLLFVVIARRMLRSAWASTLAISLLSFSFIQIAYAHEARFYAMLTMMGAIDFYLVMRLCERSTAWRLVCVIAAWTLSLYTNNLMAIYLACLAPAWLILPGNTPVRRRLVDGAIVAIVAGGLFLPWVPTMLAQTRRIRGGFWPAVPDRWSLAHTIGWLSGVHEQSLYHGDWHWFIEIDLLLVGLAAMACLSPITRRWTLALCSFGIVPVLFLFFYSRIGQSIFTERAFLPTGIAMPLLIALPLVGLRSRVARGFCAMAGVLILILSCRSIAGHQQGEHPEAWREACAFATSSSAKHRLVICCASDGEPLYRYYACDRDYGPRADVTAVPASFFALDPPRTLQRARTDADLQPLRKMLAQDHYDEVVLLASHSWWGDPGGRTLRLLQEQMTVKDLQVFTQIKVFRFVPN